MTLSFDFATYVLSANLFTYSGSVPAPVPLPPSLPVLASGLLALASVRFASRDARR